MSLSEISLMITALSSVMAVLASLFVVLIVMHFLLGKVEIKRQSTMKGIKVHFYPKNLPWFADVVFLWWIVIVKRIDDPFG